MSFKEWIYNELSGSNAYQRMVKQHPGYASMPAHVRGEFVNSAFGHSVNSSSAKKQGSQQQIQPSQFLNNSPYKDRQWNKKAEILQGAHGNGVTPLDFTDQTIHIFVQRCFGYRPLPTIRSDASRTQQQQKMLDPSSAGKNEPIVLLQSNGGKYDLKEGWHRTMSMLVWAGNNEYGAPNEQVKILKNYAQKLIELDQLFIQKYGIDGLEESKPKMEWLYETASIAEKLKSELNFSVWKPVPIRGFVGKLSMPQNPQNNVDSSSSSQFNYDATTAPMP